MSEPEITETLDVELGERSYPIYIGRGLLNSEKLLAAHIAGDKVLIVSNTKVAPLYLEPLRRACTRWHCETLIIPDGEQYKNLEVLATIFDALLEKRFSRKSTIVALGGGVVGDISGFAAACYQRGIDYLQVPTTLLAQVDSSVGGKTAVNHPLGKNMIGAFHQPKCVIIDTETLNTLDDRQLCAGIAEVIKYGLIRDRPFFEWLEASMEKIVAKDAATLAHAIERSCRNKAMVVEQDEYESGLRASLNLGHTFGHAIETGMGYGRWLHGEAVAAGTIMALDLSVRLGWLSDRSRQRVTALYRRAQLPVTPPSGLSTSRFRTLMAVDKKITDGKPRLVLLKDIGEAVITTGFPDHCLEETLQAYCN